MTKMHSKGHLYRFAKKSGSRVHNVCSKKFKIFNKDLPPYAIFKSVDYKGNVTYCFGSLGFISFEPWKQKLRDLTYISWFEVPLKYLGELKSKFQIIEESTDRGSRLFKTKSKSK